MRMHVRSTRVAAAAAVMSVLWTGAALAQSAVSIEGGAACTMGGRILVDADELGKGECGWTGAIRYDQGRSPMWMGFDAWGLGVRHMAVDQNVGASSLDEKRTTLDFDISRPMGNGLLGLGPTRFLAGIRYSGYDVDVTGTNYVVSGNYWGIGPRIGFVSTIPLGRGFQVDSLSTISVLFGNHDYTRTQGGVQTASQSNSHPVFTYESSLALTYLFSGDNGPKISAGYRSEYWLRQMNIDAEGGFDQRTRVNRNIGSPFLRVTVPLR